jgi:uncharacterized protein YkwD
MGRARIVEVLGEGLFLAKVLYNTAALENELSDLRAAQAREWILILEALQTLDRLRQAKADAREGMDAVIDQWQQGLIDKLNETAPEIPPPVPNDPATGQPWEDPDRAQDGPLFTAINAARTAAGKNALSRVNDLDTAILRHLRSLAATGSTQVNGALGTTPVNRVQQAGYLYDATVGVGLVQAFGTRDVAATLEKWLRSTSDKATLINEDYTEVGVAYVYRAGNPYTYLWGAILATPGPPLGTVKPDDNPVEQASEETETELERIEAPKVEDFSPKNLAEVAGEFAKAAQLLVVGEKALAKLQIERLERDLRIAQLEALQLQFDQPIHIWAIAFDAWLVPDDTCLTAEVPGYWASAPRAMTTTMGIRNDPNNSQPDRDVAYQERDINIIPPGFPDGRITPSECMSDAAIFVNCALEPGHLRWKPLWRYGTITAIAGNLCSLTLDTVNGRKAEFEQDFPLEADDQRALTNVPINHPPCNGHIFAVGDAVLVMYLGLDRTQPQVIGFRREPRPCLESGRVSWRQLIRA